MQPEPDDAPDGPSPNLGWPGHGPLSPADLAEVIRLRKAGMGIRELARYSGRSASTISRTCKEAGLDSDIAKPPTSDITPPTSHSELTKLRLKLVTKAAQKADLMLNAIDSPIEIRRINTRTGQTERLRARQPDPRERRDLAGGASSLIGVVNAAVKDGDPSDASKAAVVALVEHLNLPVIVASDVLDEERVHPGTFTPARIAAARKTLADFEPKGDD